MILPARIVILPRETADRIAAGEVVERPSSIVKELLENALDAGASEILIELEKGGIRSIRIVDNGEGMDREDAALAFERHATSKISVFEDLYEITSFGFRGEALPSIASVSKMEMITRKRGALSGCRIRVESGKVVENMETGCPEGTAVSVTDIFAAIPVRRKFLKKEATEQSYCLEVITRTLLPRSGVRFRVVADGKPLLHIPATADIAERVALVLGINVKDQLLPVERMKGVVKVKGFTSRPDFTRSTSRGIFCYVNGRHVKDPLISHAVMTAYRRLIEARRYPQAVLFIDVPPGDVDVNVHPAKLEVRFRNPREVYEAVLFALAGVLATIASRVEKRPPEEPAAYADAIFPEFRGRVEEALRRYAAQGGGTAAGAVKARPVWDIPDEMKYLPGRETGAGQSGFFSSLEYLGQIENTYLVFSGSRGMIVMDQHAAHERILFEKLRADSEDGNLSSQRRLLPEIVDLPPELTSLVGDSRSLLNEMGMDIEPFGGNSVRIHSFPALLSHLEPTSVILDVLGEIGEREKSPDLRELREKLLTMMSCKGAVKARERLTRSEAEQLCRDLDAIPFSSNCPHGRPLFIQFEIKDLEKLFKRS
jgi:DNA mismatch repair protein MutL